MYTATQFRHRAHQFVGHVPYVLGAQYTAAVKPPALPKAVDCSELVEGLLRENGTPWPTDDPTASVLYDGTRPVTGKCRPGDLVFLRNNPQRKNGIGHVGILVWGSGGLDGSGYIKGEPEIVEARGRAYGCQRHTLTWWRARGKFAGVRRWSGFKLAAEPKPAAKPASPAAFATLKKGSKGAAVTTLQTRLNQAGFACGKVDGDYGGKTEAAVKAMQTNAKIKATGIFDAAADTALKAIEAKLAATAAMATLQGRALYQQQTRKATDRGKTIAQIAAKNPYVGALWDQYFTAWDAITVTADCPPVPAKGHAFIILGSALKADGTLSPTMTSRLKTALPAIQAHPGSLVIVSGGAPKNGHTEGQVGRDWLIAHGIPAARVLAETSSGSTVGNARYSVAMMLAKGVTSYTLISHWTHLRRAQVHFLSARLAADTKAGKTVSPVPCGCVATVDQRRDNAESTITAETAAMLGLTAAYTAAKKAG